MGDMADMHADYADEEQWLGIESNEDDSLEELKDVFIVHETNAALLIGQNNRVAWFPKRVCELTEGSLFYTYAFNPVWKPYKDRHPKPIEGDF